MLVITVTSFLVDAPDDAPLQLTLCREHADTLLHLARRSATR